MRAQDTGRGGDDSAVQSDVSVPRYRNEPVSLQYRNSDRPNRVGL